MNEDFKPPDTDSYHEEIKYGQVIDLGPIMEKYDFPVAFVMLVIIIVLFKYAGLLSIIKDLWSGIKGMFTYKSVMIMQLKQELETLKSQFEKFMITERKLRQEAVRSTRIREKLLRLK